MIKNLVFKGGGVLGAAYAGAYDAFAQKVSIDTLQRVAGSSAGAIMATLVALKYTPAEITDITNNTDFSTFLDGWNPLREFTQYGLYKGVVFEKWIEDKISIKTKRGNATFADFHNDGYLDLTLFACDLNTGGLKVFNYILTPNVIVSMAVRASMSIPDYFPMYEIPGQDGRYIDGGTIFNYPLTWFDESCGCPNPETLGFYLTDISGKVTPHVIERDHPLADLKALFAAALNAQDIMFKNSPDMLKRTVLIDTLGISAIDFSITSEQKQSLFNSGVRAVSDYFKV